MELSELGVFDVAHGQLAWPWIAIDPTRSRFAFASSRNQISTRALVDGALVEGASFALPSDLALPAKKAPATGHRGSEQGVHGFAIDPLGALVAVAGTTGGVSVVATIDPNGEVKRSRIDALAGDDFVAHAVAFDRTGTRLWLSLESGKETALLLIDARSHAVFGVVKSAPFPPPSVHELHVHPQDDAVLLLGACGQDGTFARVAGWSDGPPVAVPGALDGGSGSAGFVGFSADGARVHLVESGALRTHAWPALDELSSIELPDDFASSYTGVVLGDRILVDGADADTGDEDAVMIFDRSALRGSFAKPPFPAGMWVGRLGADALVTVASKGDPARGRVVALPAPRS